MLRAINIEHQVEEDDIPLCPLCDQPMFSVGEPLAVGLAFDCACLVHEMCLEEE